MQPGDWRRAEQACGRPTSTTFPDPPSPSPLAVQRFLPTLGVLNKVCSRPTVWKYCTLFIDSCSVWQRVCTRHVDTVTYIICAEYRIRNRKEPGTPPIGHQVLDLFSPHPQLLISFRCFFCKSSAPPDNAEIQAKESAAEGRRLEKRNTGCNVALPARKGSEGR